MEELNLKKIDPPERKRIYHFPDRSLTIENVTALCVRQSGTHRLEIADGKKCIVNPWWLMIELDMDQWTL